MATVLGLLALVLVLRIDVVEWLYRVVGALGGSRAAFEEWARVLHHASRMPMLGLLGYCYLAVALFLVPRRIGLWRVLLLAVWAGGQYYVHAAGLRWAMSDDLWRLVAWSALPVNLAWAGIAGLVTRSERVVLWIIVASLGASTARVWLSVAPVPGTGGLGALVTLGWHAVVACALVSWAWRERVRAQRAGERCVECDYDLRGIEEAERCPECGAVVGMT